MEGSSEQHDEPASTLAHVRRTASSVSDAGSNILALLHSLSVEQLETFEESLRAIKEQKLALISSTSHRGTAEPSMTSAPVPVPSSATAPTLPGATTLVPVQHSATVETTDGVPWLTFTYKVKQQERHYKIRVDIERVTALEIADEVFRANNCVYPKANGPEELYRGTRWQFEQECNEQGWRLAYLNSAVLEGNKALIQRAVVCFRNSSTASRSRRAFRKDKIASGLFRKHLHPRRSRKDCVTEPGDISLTEGSQQELLASRQPGLFIQWQPLQQSAPPIDRSSAAHLKVSNNTDVQLRDTASKSSVGITPKNSLRKGDVIIDPQVGPRLGTFEHRPPPTTPVPTNQQRAPPPLTWKHAVFSLDVRFAGKVEKLELVSDIDHILVEDLPADFKSANSVFPRAYIAADADADEATIQWAMFGIRRAEESLLNEIGWKLCWANQERLAGKKLLLQQALDAYRKKFLPATFQPRGRIGPTMQPKAWRPARDTAQDSPSVARDTWGRSPSQEPQHARNEAERGEDAEQDDASIGRFSTLTHRHKTVSFIDDEIVRAESNQSSTFPNLQLSDRRGSVIFSENESANVTRNQDDSAEDTGDGSDQEEKDSEDDDYSGLAHSSVLEEIDRFLTNGSESDTSSDDDDSSDEGMEHSQMSLLSITGKIRTYSLGTGSGSARSRPVDRSTMSPSANSSRQDTLKSRVSASSQYMGATSSSGHRSKPKARSWDDDTQSSSLTSDKAPPLLYKRARLEMDQAAFYDNWARLYEETQGSSDDSSDDEGHNSQDEANHTNE